MHIKQFWHFCHLSVFIQDIDSMWQNVPVNKYKVAKIYSLLTVINYYKRDSLLLAVKHTTCT